MTYDPHHPVTPQNYPPVKRRRTGLILGLVAAVLFALCGLGTVIAAASGTDPKPGGTALRTPGATPEPAAGKVPDPGVRPEPGPKTFTTKDFEASVKVRSKDCIDFSTIPDSCTFTYEVRLLISDLDGYKRAGDSYSVTYAVKGLKGGEQVDTVEIDGDGQFMGMPGFGTGTPKTKLTVRVTDVERRP